MLLADLGAEVIKIETPHTGDPSCRSGELGGEVSFYFETNNRGIKSLTLNLKHEEGQAILHRLIRDAEIFGQNFRPGATERNTGSATRPRRRTTRPWSTCRFPGTARRVPIETCRAPMPSGRHREELPRPTRGRVNSCVPVSCQSPTSHARCSRLAACWRRCTSRGRPAWARRSRSRSPLAWCLRQPPAAPARTSRPGRAPVATPRS